MANNQNAVLHTGLLRELDQEVREVDLRLSASGRLEADLEGREHGRSDGAQEVVELGDAAGVAALTHFASSRTPLSSGQCEHALTQVRLVRTEQRSHEACAMRIHRHGQTAFDHLANSLASWPVRSAIADTVRPCCATPESSSIPSD